MAYSVITSPVTGTTISTVDFGIKVKDNFDAAFPLGVDGWTSYVPTLTQSGTVTATVNYAKYQRVGRLITCQVFLTVTGSGTASNAVVMSLPVTAAFASETAVGSGYLLDTSANANYAFIAILNTTTALRGIPCSTDQAQYLGVGVFTAALAVGDRFFVSFTYEAAT